MLADTILILQRELGKALWETGIMLFISSLISTLLGIALGMYLYLSSEQNFIKNKLLNSIVGGIINIVRSIPFIILVVFSLPFTFLITGTKIGPVAAAVPLSIAATVFLARIVEGAFKDVDKGVLEAAFAQGANNYLIIKDVLFVEAAPAIVRGITITFISLIGFSAMAGMVGGGGIGNLAIQYGYYRYETGVMIFTIISLVIVVQLSQILGDYIAKKLSH